MNISSLLIKIAGFAAEAYRVAPDNALLLCLSAGNAVPEYAAPMLRSPQPLTGFEIDNSFAMRYAAALKVNREIHDGAIMACRAGEHYVVSGWSYRLFPPPIVTVPTANRGSAFHSCLAMSAIRGIDGLLLFSGKEAIIFREGATLKEADSLTVGLSLDG